MNVFGNIARSLEKIVPRQVKDAAANLARQISESGVRLVRYIPDSIRRRLTREVGEITETIPKAPPPPPIPPPRKETKKYKFKPRLHDRALNGYLNTYIIDGKPGYGPTKFLRIIKKEVLDLINKEKKPFKFKFIFTCHFMKENPATGQIDIHYCPKVK